ncbi:MAG: hypothetical protein WCI90_09295 [Chlorobium sp.]
MQKIIITDFTRFSNPKIVCTAGIDLTNGQCIRPMPYLNAVFCKSENIVPGAILTGEFTPVQNLTAPHQEDMSYKNLSCMGPCTSSEFKLALHAGLCDSVENGFQIALADNQKHIPISHAIGKSIITIKIQPDKIEIVEGTYNQKKIKLNFTDNSGRVFKYIPITDLGFHGFAESIHLTNGLDTLNEFICSQSEVYLRLGLSRPWDNGKINGYWMQVNGLYTFPDYHHEIRSYR